MAIRHVLRLAKRIFFSAIESSLVPQHNLRYHCKFTSPVRAQQQFPVFHPDLIFFIGVCPEPPDPAHPCGVDQWDAAPSVRNDLLVRGRAAARTQQSSIATEHRRPSGYKINVSIALEKVHLLLESRWIRKIVSVHSSDIFTPRHCHRAIKLEWESVMHSVCYHLNAAVAKSACNLN